MQADDYSYNIAVTFRHTDSTDALKSYAQEKINQTLKKYVHQNAEVHVVLSVEKLNHIAEVVMHSKGPELTAKAVEEDLYAAIDKVVDTISTQLRRRKGKIVDRHKHGGSLEQTELG